MGAIVGNVIHACLIALEVFNILNLWHAYWTFVFSYFVPEFKLVDVLLDLSDFLALCLKHRSRTLFHGFDSPHHDVVQVLGLTHHRISNIVDTLSNIGSFSSNCNVRSKSDDVSLVFEEISEVDKPDEIFHEFDLLLESRLSFDLLNLSEGFSHNCDKHVHKDDNKKECGHQEGYPQDHFVTMFVGVVIIFEVALRKHPN